METNYVKAKPKDMERKRLWCSIAVFNVVMENDDTDENDDTSQLSSLSRSQKSAITPENRR